jgi:hypothetical protein
VAEHGLFLAVFLLARSSTLLLALTVVEEKEDEEETAESEGARQPTVQEMATVEE